MKVCIVVTLSSRGVHHLYVFIAELTSHRFSNLAPVNYISGEMVRHVSRLTEPMLDVYSGYVISLPYNPVSLCPSCRRY